MLTRCLISKLIFPIAVSQARAFRHNPYVQTSAEVTSAERQVEKEKPVWERRFDFHKYMIQKGPLKVFLHSHIFMLIAFNWIGIDGC